MPLRWQPFSYLGTWCTLSDKCYVASNLKKNLYSKNSNIYVSFLRKSFSNGISGHWCVTPFKIKICDKIQRNFIRKHGEKIQNTSPKNNSSVLSSPFIQLSQPNRPFLYAICLRETSFSRQRARFLCWICVFFLPISVFVLIKSRKKRGRRFTIAWFAYSGNTLHANAK